MLIDNTPSGELILIKAAVFLEVIYRVISVLCCLYILYVNIHSDNADNGSLSDKYLTFVT